MAGILAAMSASKLAGPLVAGAVAMGAGFAASELYEHAAPWGLKAQLMAEVRKEPALVNQGQVAGVKQQAASDASAFASWQSSLNACNATLASNRDIAATAIVQNDKSSSQQASAAYQMGRASCTGAPNAPSPPPAAGGHAGGVPDDHTDFADAFAPGAFATAPAAAVPR